MKRSDIPSLDDLRAFEAVARLHSVRAAADELSLTHGAVSRRVSKLAEDIRLKLFVPDGRGIRLTEDGEKLASSTSKAFLLIRETLTELYSTTKSSPIVVSCERSIAMRWLIPRLSRFQDMYPNIDVHLSTGGGPLDFARERVALAVRRLDFPIDPDWTVTRLVSEAMGPVMVPAMSERFTSGDYVALGSRTRPNAWENWLKLHPGVNPPRTIRLLDHHFLMVEAALGGLGVALSPRMLTEDEVSGGRLFAPSGYSDDGTHYGIIHPAAMPLSADVLTIVHWLQREVAQGIGVDRT
jgi:DNA-binding transcriptional LysR family regulator